MYLPRETALTQYSGGPGVRTLLPRKAPSHTHLPENFQEPPFVLCQERLLLMKPKKKPQPLTDGLWLVVAPPKQRAYLHLPTAQLSIFPIPGQKQAVRYHHHHHHLLLCLPVWLSLLPLRPSSSSFNNTTVPFF